MAAQKETGLKLRPNKEIVLAEARARSKNIIKRCLRLSRNKYIKPAKDQPKPNLKDRLFWDWKLDEINWRRAARLVIERVLVRGNDEEYEEIIRFYGRDRILHVLTKERCFLPNYRLDRVTGYFGLKMEDIPCYRDRQGRVDTWI
jgi:hypothetical protein